MLRRPLHNGLTLCGLAAAIALFVSLKGFQTGYERALTSELNRMGLQLMLVPLGCPYDAAARVLKGKALENTLPETALAQALQDPAVAVAAPLLISAVPRPREHRVDLWVGLDRAALNLKPWWRAATGTNWFPTLDSVIMGCDAAETEMRSPGDPFLCPEPQTEIRVAGVLERSGTSDDSLFFLPLATAQRMFGATGRLTAVGIRLRDPLLLQETSERLQRIPGAQVVTITEMTGVFLNLVAAARTLLQALAWVAVAVSSLSVFNTLLSSVLERTDELSVLRAIGASRVQTLSLIGLEALLLAALGSALGLLLSLATAPAAEDLARRFLPFAPHGSFFLVDLTVVTKAVAVGVLAGLLGALYPVWRASRLNPAAALKGV